jgi:hypothetical protein
MIDTNKRNEIGRIAYNVTRIHRARYRSRLDGSERETYTWSTPESAREFWYQLLIRGIETATDVHNNVTVDLRKTEAA